MLGGSNYLDLQNRDIEVAPATQISSLGRANQVSSAFVNNKGSKGQNCIT